MAVVFLAAAGCANRSDSDTATADGSVEETGTSGPPDAPLWAVETCAILLGVRDTLGDARVDLEAGDTHGIIVGLAGSLDAAATQLTGLAAQAPTTGLESTLSQLAEHTNSAAGAYAAVSERTSPEDFESEGAEAVYEDLARQTAPAAQLLVESLYDFVVLSPDYTDLNEAELDAISQRPDAEAPEGSCAVLAQRMVSIHE